MEENGRDGCGDGSGSPYMNAARAGKKALCMLTISDHLFRQESISASERQSGIRTDDGDRAGIITVQGKGVGCYGDTREILRHVDHTLLSQTATWEEIRTLCDDAIAYGTASVCIPLLM